MVLLLGVALFLGNLSGLFPTFPYAGYLTMTVGGAMMGFAARAMAIQEDKEQLDKEDATRFAFYERKKVYERKKD
jgi:hypothetical protein